MSKERVLVLGGGGFIGVHLCNHLVMEGYQVTAFGRTLPDDLHPSIERIVGDFAKQNDVREAVHGKDYVFHLIHGTNPPLVNSDISGDLSRTVAPTISLLDECVGAKVKRIIYLSSGGTVYGNNGMVASRESDPTKPMNAYGAHKLLIENYLRVYASSRRLDYRVLRLSNPYGPLQQVSKGVGLVSAVIESIKSNTCIEIFGDGENQRDYIYIEDAVKAITSAMKHKGEYRIFNVGSGEGKSINQIIEIVEKVMGRDVQRIFKPARSFDVRKSILDISLAKVELQWHPECEIYDGITKTIGNG